MRQLGYDLNTFPDWRTSAITRFTLHTTPDGAIPKLIVDDDPSTIQYHTVTSFRHRFNGIHTLPSIDDSNIQHVQWLGSFRYVSLVDLESGRYVRKSIDPERPETLKGWENEYLNLTHLQASPYIVDLVGTRNPYSPAGEDVVTAFLIEYGQRGTLKQLTTNVGTSSLSRWMLQVAKGLRDMHQVGIIYGHLKLENVVVTESDQAKIIDLAQSGYTAPYYAPEFPELFESKTQWQPCIDIYSFGVVYWRLLPGTAENLPQPHDNQPSPLINLIAQCVSTNPLERPSVQNVIDFLEHDT